MTPQRESAAGSLSSSGTDAVLRALADPQRRRILRLVRDGERAAGEIAAQFEITPQAVSQHLKVLRENGLLHERREGTRRLYAIRPEALEPVRQVLDDLWPAALARLRNVVESDLATTRGRRQRPARP